MKSFVLLMAGGLLFLSGCSFGKDSGPEPVIIKIKGNPKVFLAGTKRDKSSGLPIELFEDGQKWRMSVRGMMKTLQEKGDKPFETIKKEQAAPTEAKQIKSDEPKYVFAELPNQEGANYEFRDSENPDYTFTFTNRSGKLFVDKIEFGGDDRHLIRDATVEHYSVKKDGNAFSVLISAPNVGSDILYSYEFTKLKEEPLVPQILNMAYSYLLGPGVKAGWDQNQETKLTICRQLRNFHNFEDIRAAATRWKDEVLHNRLNYSVSDHEESCPPFSDLNTHTLMHVSDWVEVEGRQGKTGFAFSFFDLGEHQLIDSDIFILDSEFEELFGVSLSNPAIANHPTVLASYRRTVTHEVGHWIGLHHMFNEGVPSIMGYDGERDFTEYDVQAAQALYPELPEDSPMYEKEESEVLASGESTTTEI